MLRGLQMGGWWLVLVVTGLLRCSPDETEALRLIFSCVCKVWLALGVIGELGSHVVFA